MATSKRQLAVVTGASTGIGYELGKAVRQGRLRSDHRRRRSRRSRMRRRDCATGRAGRGGAGRLSATEGVDKLYAAIGRGRQVDALLANAGRGLGRGFLDQDFDRLAPASSTPTSPARCYLVHKVGARHARARRRPHPDHRLDRRLHAGHLPGRLQRQQGVPRLLLLRPARTS